MERLELGRLHDDVVGGHGRAHEAVLRVVGAEADFDALLGEECTQMDRRIRIFEVEVRAISVVEIDDFPGHCAANLTPLDSPVFARRLRDVVVPCPNCSKPNRLPASRMTDRAKCAACKNPLLPVHQPIPVDRTEDFEELVRDAKTPVLVDFWATWCPPCKLVAPELDKLAAERAGRLVTAKVDTEALPAIANRFGIRSIPTMILFRCGREEGRVSGAMPASAIAEQLRLP